MPSCSTETTQNDAIQIRQGAAYVKQFGTGTGRLHEIILNNLFTTSHLDFTQQTNAGILLRYSNLFFPPCFSLIEVFSSSLTLLAPCPLMIFVNVYQSSSSSSSFFPFIALCLALSASASPPANDGVLLPESVPNDKPESRGPPPIALAVGCACPA